VINSGLGERSQIVKLAEPCAAVGPRDVVQRTKRYVITKVITSGAIRGDPRLFDCSRVPSSRTSADSFGRLSSKQGSTPLASKYFLINYLQRLDDNRYDNMSSVFRRYSPGFTQFYLDLFPVIRDLTK